MYIEHTQVKKGNTVYSKIRLCEYSNGIRKRHYPNVRKNPFLYLLIRECLTRRLLGEPVHKGTVFLSPGRGPGRPPIYTKKQKAHYEACGYSVRGRKLQINRKTHYTFAAAKERFKMFNKREQQQLGSVKRMLKIDKKARSIYNAAKVNSGNLTLNEALLQAIDEEL